ncbi:substrate-binding periplasmic protein [Oxalobacteraceae bacterium A2-2]
MIISKPLALAGTLACLCLGARAAEPVYTVAWRDKPPYHYVENGVSKGFLLERVKAVFAAAGLKIRLVNEPQKRIWTKLQHGADHYCSLSWHKLSERATVAQYSNPLHQDQPQTVLIAPGAVAQVKAHPTLATLMADPALTMGVIDGLSYGPVLDEMIAASQNQIMRRTVDTMLMMRMVSVDRASYMVTDRYDWEYYRRNNKDNRLPLRYDFPDMPPGLKRHIVCSRDVPAAIMARINHGIAVTGGMSESRASGLPADGTGQP